MITCKLPTHGRSWGLTPDKMEWIHTAVVRLKMTYWSVVWAGSMTKSMTSKLTKVQRLSLLSIIHPLRSAPTAGLEVMVGWTPLHLHAQNMGMITHMRNRSVLTVGWD